jgi:hypothetical protein
MSARFRAVGAAVQSDGRLILLDVYPPPGLFRIERP